MNFLKAHQRNEQKQLLHYRKGIQYKRQKCSLYLQEKIYKKLIEISDEISEKNKLSISECGQRLLVQSMGYGFIW